MDDKSEITDNYEEYLESFWCLYHKPTKALIDGLSWRQLRAFIATIAKENISLWLVWREGEMEWSKLGDRINKILAAAVSRMAIPPLAPELDSGTMTRTKTRPALSGTKTKTGSFGIDRRMTKRFSKVVDVIMQLNQQTYKNRTKNISVMGIKLEMDVPFETEETFQVFLNLREGPLELLCQLNKNDMGLSRNQLRILPTKNIEKLADYLTLD